MSPHEENEAQVSKTQHQQNYSLISTQYDSIESIPHSKISQQLVLYALGNCTSLTLLDSGGGSGLHARHAIAAGATRVDNVDISPSMLQNCSAAANLAGPEIASRIECYIGDVSKPLTHLNLPGKPSHPGLYDIILVNWTFDQASTLPELEAMWSNCVLHCAPGGKLISIRSCDPRKRSPNFGKYGVQASEMDVQDGVRYKFTVGFEKPFTALATSLDANLDLEQAREMARCHGFGELEVVPAEEMEVVKEDLEFWEDFVRDPGFICVV